MKQCKLIPIPKSYDRREGSIPFVPTIECAYEPWQTYLQTYCQCASKIYRTPVTIGEGGVVVIRDESIPAEHYILDIDQRVVLRAGDHHGCLYGLASVLQLVNKKQQWEKVHIEDYPDKEYRGFMLDLARHWHPYRQLQHYVNLCFFFKIKYLHLHLMDDEGYTLPSKVYPNLPTKGKSYTFEQIEEFRALAASRGIVLIPEIETPGHALSLMESYPEDFANRFDMEENKRDDLQMHFHRDSVICVGSERVFGNLTKLIDEVMELFPESPYIHLGADEVQTNAWSECSVCRAYMQEKGIADEHELYAHFLAKVTNYVLEKGRTPIVWEGFSEKYNHMIDKRVVVQGFECYYQDPDKLLNAGFRVINCAWKPLYIVPTRYHQYHGMLWGIKELLQWNVYEWWHFSRFSSATLNPIRVPEGEQMMGAQLCSWDGTFESEMSEIVMRLTAFSEKTWTVKRYCTEQEFCKRLDSWIWKPFELIMEE